MTKHVNNRSNTYYMLGNFIKQPQSVIQAQGLEAVFECLYEDPGGAAIIYTWIVDGEYYNGATSSVRGITLPPYPDGPISLNVTALPQHNNTSIQCEANIRIPGVSQKRQFQSCMATLRVHGE